MFNPRLTWPRPDVDLPHCGASKDSQQREKPNDVRGLTTCCCGDTQAGQNRRACRKRLGSASQREYISQKPMPRWDESAKPTRRREGDPPRFPHLGWSLLPNKGLTSTPLIYSPPPLSHLIP